MRNALLVAAACIGLTACNEEKTYTVDELLNDPATLGRIYKECGNDPGRLGSTPNCKNAAQARWKASLNNMHKALSQ